MQFKNRVAYVTGAGSGLGRAAAVALARQGARVGLMSRTEEELEEARAEIEGFGGEALVLPADVTDAAALRQSINDVVARWGRLDIVFANAGVNGVWAPIDELTPEEWRRTIDINLTGTFLTVKYAVEHMRARGGSIVISSSINGTRIFSSAGASAYGCSKVAQATFAKFMALELAKHKIRVNAICPGRIESEIEDNQERRHTEKAAEPVEFPEGQIPLTDGAPGRAEQVADLVLFLASDAASHITGTDVWIDGGQSLMRG